MRVSKFKGLLLEYLVRRLLRNCGFTNVAADGMYTFQQRGLFFINGKGAAHDADVLMEPPVQMPFSYPSRILFECKAYGTKTGLSIIRNALGLRYDINEFEIVTKATLLLRQNNRRAPYAIEDRRRYNYQVGVATINDFTKPAVEFAANSKILLLSLSWFLQPQIIDTINQINQDFINQFSEEQIEAIQRLFKDRNPQPETDSQYEGAIASLSESPVTASILAALDPIIESSFFAVNEAGDFFFLYPTPDTNLDNFRNLRNSTRLQGRIHFSRNERNIWRLSLSSDLNWNNTADFKFFVPERIMRLWARFSFDKSEAATIKQHFFSRIFIFDGNQERELPFIVVTIDRPWLDGLQANLTGL